jgi:thiol:disulfide interchange protein DsbD
MTQLLPTLVRLNLYLLFAIGALAPTSPVSAADDFLPAKEAYKVETGLSDGRLTVRYAIAPGYYLYRDRLGFESATPGVEVGAPAFPAGEDHEDEYFGRQVVYRDVAAVTMPVTFEGAPRPFDVRLRLQGCADAGLCYPPQTWTVTVTASTSAALGETVRGTTSPGAPAPTGTVAPGSGAASDAAGAGREPAAGAAAAGSGGFSLSKLFGGRQKTDADFLPVDQAFVLSASSSQRDRITLRWDIADDYYLYRDKLKLAIDGSAATLGQPQIPGGQVEHDEYFGEQVVFYGEMVANVPVSAPAGTQQLELQVTYQGCADAGLCYPPTMRRVSVELGTSPEAADRSAGDRAPLVGGKAPLVSEQDALARRIRDGNLLGVLAFFFGAGLLLAFTPCVLPMVPILSGIIVGAGRDRPVSRGRAFALSLAYVLGMALTYTVAGAAFAAMGQQAQAFFQKPWIIVIFAGLFVLLALGMFGVFNLQVPSAFQARVSDLSNRQQQGSLLGTAVMGALSSLIVTACVAPPLVAALAVIGQSGDVVRGAAALFALSLGMGAPLLIVGASAGQLLPKAGPWMDSVKAVFGVMLLGVAIWMLGRILPGPVALALWAALAFVSGYCLMTLGGREIRGGGDAVRRGLGALAIVYGVLMLIGALAGRSDPLQPLAGLGHSASASVAENSRLEFTRIKSVADLERELASARSTGRPVMLDFYADWCVSCKEMERFTFTDPGVQAEFARARLLQADVTANDAEDQALLQRFGILGPPSIVFFDALGRERPEFRIVGFKPAEEFRAHLATAFGDEST